MDDRFAVLGERFDGYIFMLESLVCVFPRHVRMCELLKTPIADIGCPIEALTAFTLEVRAVLITGWT